MLPTGTKRENIAARLLLLRQALFGDQRGAQAAFAKSIEMTGSEWNNLERGTRNITLAKLTQIRNRHFVSTDWILYGDVNTLSSDLREKLILASQQYAAQNV